jgi:crotonobetainyl-CoA:carnitine CoA-transferase CaiB-like acyl-CoA transferase
MLPRVELPGTTEPVAVPGVPVKLSVTPGGVRVRAPMVGEHTREILGELGVPSAQVDGLIARGVIGAA